MSDNEQDKNAEAAPEATPTDPAPAEQPKADETSAAEPAPADPAPEVTPAAEPALVVGFEPETGRDLCRVRRNGKRKGYRKDILTDNLSDRDAVFFCNRCQGIVREACISTDGGQFCSCCKKEDEQTNPNIHVSNMILSFKCSCPLMVRGCGWLGTLRNCEDHLDTCDYVYETCKLRCGVVLQRNELNVHEMEKCPHRLVECKHCNNEFKSCELYTHLDKCPKMEVLCELKCGNIMCREVMTQHLKQDCGLMVEMCKLGCGKEITRNEHRIHMTDTCVQRLIQCKHCKGDFKFCDMSSHLDVCPKMEVSCELKCGVVMCREDMAQHLKQECVEKEVECPFVKYKCELASIKRKYLSQHLEEKRTEHLELKLNAIELKLNATEEIAVKQNAIELKLNAMEVLTVKQNETIEKLNRTITELSREKEKSPRKIEILEKVSKPTLGIASNNPSYVRSKGKNLAEYNPVHKPFSFKPIPIDFRPPPLPNFPTLKPATEHAFK